MITTHTNGSHAHYRNERGGLSTMAYVLWFAFATFCVIITTFAVLASRTVEPAPEEPAATSHGPGGHHG